MADTPKNNLEDFAKRMDGKVYVDCQYRFDFPTVCDQMNGRWHLLVRKDYVARKNKPFTCISCKMHRARINNLNRIKLKKEHERSNSEDRG